MAYLSGFSNRLKLTIQPDDVDNSLTDFPVMINLSSSAGKTSFDATPVFDELGDANQKCIAVTKNDGITQCPVEIEYWDATEEKAILWTKIPTVYSSVDTDIYLYYDATYSGTATISGGNTGYVGDVNDTTYEMILNIGAEGTYDTTHAYTPFVIKESNTSYKMWYTGYDGTNYRILYATSTNGTTWTGHQMVVNINNISYDTMHAHTPCVIKESDTSYKMWYSGSDGTNYRILYAVSTDGISWTGHQMVVNINNTSYDTVHVWAPFVIKESNTFYKMWYTGYDGTNYRILYAVSTNGTTWTGHQMIVNINNISYDSVHVVAPHVIKESDTSYKMWYAGHDGTNYRILYAISTNGTTWGNFEMVLDKDCEGTYDTTHAMYMCVLESDLNRMWYTGHDGTNYRIMHSTYWKNPAQEVWDDNFKLVMHMSQDPSGGTKCIKDSTFNTNNGTPAGGMTTGDLVDGKIGKGIEFDGGDDYISCGSATVIDDIAVKTIEAVINFDTFGESNSGRVIQKSNINIAGWQVQVVGGAGSNRLHFTQSWNSGTAALWHTDQDTIVTSQIYGLGIVYDKGSTTNKPLMYIDGAAENVTENTAPLGSCDSDAANDLWVGARNNSGPDREFDGIIDEVRISDTERSAPWIKTTYNSNWDNLLIFQQEEITTNWLTNWSKRIKLTIDHTKVDTTLVDFPVAVTLASGTSTEPVFDELSTVSGTKKIAITTNDGITQCYVEIERWDEGNEQANLWTKVPSVSSNEDTILYLYYDSSKSDNTTYIGDTGDAVAQNVWDDNFKMVQHMKDLTTSTIKDSTSNVNNGTKIAANRPIETDGKIGKAQDFEKSTSDYINLPSHTFGTLFTLEFIIKPESLVNWEEVFGEVFYISGCIIHSDGRFGSYIGNGGSWGNGALGPVGALVAGNTYYIQVTYDGVNLTNYKNLVQNATAANTISIPATTLCIGMRGVYYYDGLIDEVRISNIKRSSAWRKATYYSNWNSLITYGSEQERPIFLFNGYVKVEGFPAARTVYLYKRSDGELVGDVISNSSTGYFEIGSSYNEYHFTVILPELTETYNLLSYDKIDPGV